MHSLCPLYNSYSPHIPLRPSHIRNLALVFTGAIHCIPPHTCSLDILLHQLLSLCTMFAYRRWSFPFSGPTCLLATLRCLYTWSLSSSHPALFIVSSSVLSVLALLILNHLVRGAGLRRRGLHLFNLAIACRTFYILLLDVP